MNFFLLKWIKILNTSDNYKYVCPGKMTPLDKLRQGLDVGIPAQILALELVGLQYLVFGGLGIQARNRSVMSCGISPCLRDPANNSALSRSVLGGIAASPTPAPPPVRTPSTLREKRRPPSRKGRRRHGGDGRAVASAATGSPCLFLLPVVFLPVGPLPARWPLSPRRTSSSLLAPSSPSIPLVPGVPFLPLANLLHGASLYPSPSSILLNLKSN